MKNPCRILVVLLASTTLAGCGTLRGARDALNEEATRPLPSPNLALASATRDDLVGLGYALSLSGMANCSEFVDSNQPKREVRNDTRCGGPNSRGVSTTDMAVYLDRSIFVIDAYCDAYLSSLAAMGNSSRWTRSQFNTLANYIGVLMALAGEPTENLGYLNAATGFFNASADNLETFVLISPTPGKIGPLVAEAQAEKLATVAALSQGDATFQWSRTSRWIQDYAAQCTPRGIRLLIDDAIDSSAPSGSPVQQADAARQYGAVLGSALSGIPGVNVATLDLSILDSPAALGALAWRISDQANMTVEQRGHVAGLLGNNLNQTIDLVMADPGKRQVLLGVISGPGQPAFNQLIRNARAAEAAQSSSARALQAQAAADAEKKRADEAVIRAAELEREVIRLTALVPGEVEAESEDQ